MTSGNVTYKHENNMWPINIRHVKMINKSEKWKNKNKNSKQNFPLNTNFLHEIWLSCVRIHFFAQDFTSSHEKSYICAWRNNVTKSFLHERLAPPARGNPPSLAKKYQIGTSLYEFSYGLLWRTRPSCENPLTKI